MTTHFFFARGDGTLLRLMSTPWAATMHTNFRERPQP